MNIESERNTLKYRETIVWSSLIIDAGNLSSKDVFIRQLKRERTSIEKITVEKGTATSKNNDLETFIYF